MPRNSPREKPVKASLVTLMVEPLVISRPMPFSAVKVASVMMKGGRPMRTTPKAWNAPMAMPTSERGEDREPEAEHHGRALGKADAGERLAKPGTMLSISMATMTVMKLAIAPTERSMPPVMITKVWPSARIAKIAPWRARFEMLPGVAEAGRLPGQEEEHRQEHADQRQRRAGGRTRNWALGRRPRRRCRSWSGPLALDSSTACG